MKRIVTVVGARPQFIKAAPLSRVLRKEFEEIMIHTGQHYDDNMSEIFFTQLSIPRPDENLGVGSGSHAHQTGLMMMKLEKVFNKYSPECIVIYGDTNSTLAASIAASKLHIPVAHVEAGLRNFDLSIPEEVNRVVADRLSKFLFAPTQTALINLAKEGINENVFLTGDVMFDTLLYGLDIAQRDSTIINTLNLSNVRYTLCTIHRAENTNAVDNLVNIMDALGSLDDQVVFPIHPRTQKVLEDNTIRVSDNIRMIPSVGYLDFLQLELNAQKIITDSGGVQREAYCLKKPCITIFPSTSWVETVEDGWNTLVDCDRKSIIAAYDKAGVGNAHHDHFGDGHASERIVNILKQKL